MQTPKPIKVPQNLPWYIHAYKKPTATTKDSVPNISSININWIQQLKQGWFLTNTYVFFWLTWLLHSIQQTQFNFKLNSREQIYHVSQGLDVWNKDML
jgi:hypothetical protein